MVRKIFTVLTLAFLFAACSPISASPLSPDALDLGPWTLKMEHTGGIAGVSRTIEISSDGNYTIVDNAKKQTVKGKLSEAELSDLVDLLNAVNPAKVPQVQDTGCADCFIYTVEFDNGDKPIKAQVNDVTLKESGLEPLVTFLRALIDKNLG